ncbi:MAG: hypothetical protein Kow0063_27010 [Anaerolineae bacterium]
MLSALESSRLKTGVESALRNKERAFKNKENVATLQLKKAIILFREEDNF